MFEYDGNTWQSTPTILAPDGGAFNEFGTSVDISGSFAIIGAAKHNHTGNPGGAAYIYERSGGSWSLIQEIRPPDLAGSDYFGKSVSISSDRAIIGAPLVDDNGTNSGAAYIYFYNGSSWIAGQKITASDPALSDMKFGDDVVISGNYAVVGAYKKADLSDFKQALPICFRWNGSVWQEINKLLSSDIAAGDQFGFAVAISGNNMLIGSKANDDDGSASGSVYFFEASPDDIYSPQAIDADSIQINGGLF
ncbi:MAG: FG-GAP repeat protein [Chitinophagales bacterium]